ncbi:TonB-dependent receptor [Acidithiobacillus caldus]
MKIRKTIALSVGLALVASIAAAVTGVAEADNAPINVGTVSAATQGGSADVSAKRKVSKRYLLNHDNTMKVIGRHELAAAGPAAGAAGALAYAPGVSVSTYGSNGSSKASISINGIKTGWAGFSGGNFDNGSIGVTFDGIPMVNPGNGLWQADLVPQNFLVSDIAVGAGPGNVVNQWYNNIGGSINFIPVEPNKHFSVKVQQTYGSFDTLNTALTLQTGAIDGWETVFAAGFGESHNFMTAPDGFKSPSNNYAYYLKTRKHFQDGTVLSLGVYAARSAAYRPLPTPVSPIPGVTINGYQQPGTLFSQQTTGFYTTLPYNVNNKVDTNQIAMVYGKLRDPLTQQIWLHNNAYYVEGTRVHSTALHDYVPGSESHEEYNNPHSFWLGDKLWLGFRLPYNHVQFGGYVQTSRYKSQEDLFNSQLGFVNSPTPTTLTGSRAVPNGPYFSDIFHQLNAAVFLRDDIQPVKTVHIVPALRYINYSTDFTPNEQSAFPLAYQLNQAGAASQHPPASTTFSRLAPSVSLRWHPLHWLTAYASYEQAFRQPENGGGTGPYVTIPASQVNLEKVSYYQGGVKTYFKHVGLLHDAYLDVGLFHANFSHELLPTALSSFGFLLAKGFSVYNGVNVSAGANLGYHISTFLNASFLHTYFKSFTNGNGTFSDVPVAYVPNHTFNLGIMGKYFFGGILVKPNIAFQYEGSQYMYNNSTNITSHQKIPAYGLVNLGLDLRVPMRRYLSGLDYVDLNAQILNLFNRRYNGFEYVSSGGAYGAGGYTNPTTVGQGAILAYPGAPRVFHLTVTAKF